MKKKWVYVIIGFLVIAAIIGVGGKVYMDKVEEKKEAEKIEVERMSVEALKNTFEDIKTVKIKKSGYDVMTGAHTMFVELTNKKDKSVSFSYSFWRERVEIGSYTLKDEQIQSKGITNNEVEIKYSNGEKEVY
ncbi:hypothetical protein [Paraliobacillus sp. JSM ZJ581]|uniref:hypothetical protein n=1 Tax=Paraliobacillus sp. JSM ZJ581 TaxID=3342118 RepID=UPI0035A8CCA9